MGTDAGGTSLRGLPKVELHLHLEGCLHPGDAFRLALRNGAGLSRNGILALYRHRDFGEFLAHFGALLDLFRGPEDLVWLLHRTARRLARQGILHAELRISPSVWERHGLSPLPCLKALLEARRTLPLSVLFIVDAVRQWDRAGIERDLGLALRFQKEGVAALGLGGDERAAPAGLFRDLAEECRRRRLPLIPHAGEVTGPGEVRRALELAPFRIGHGIAAASDPELLARLAEEGVHLEVCPTSNRKTGAVPRGRSHPLPALWRAGVSLSLGTDDPALFATTLNGEIAWALRRGWSPADALRSQRLAAQASLLSPAERRDLLARLG
ncbi:MAG: adenosine deaminase family protein [Acidobacteriota bacterium]